MKRISLFCLTWVMTVLAYGCDTAVDEPQQPGEDHVEKLKVSIIGDSYSTFDGWSNKDITGVPNDYWIYYPALDVTSVDKTWWYMLCQKPEFILEVNNSYSASTICHTWYGGQDVSTSELSFINRVGKKSTGVDYMGTPDIILVFGGTNDAWAGVSMGDYVYENWTAADLRCFRGGLSKLLMSLKEAYPEAKLYNIQNSGNTGAPELTAPVATSIPYICRDCGVPNIILKNIAKEDNHPTYAGMQAICSQVYDVLTGKTEPSPEPEGEPEVSGGVKLEGQKIEYTAMQKYFIEYKTGEAVVFNDPAWWITDYVAIPENVTMLSVAPITIYDGGNTGNQTCPVAFYDADKKYLKEGSYPPPGTSSWAGDIIDMTIPAEAAYVRFCWTDYKYVHSETGEQVDLAGKINAVWPELK